MTPNICLDCPAPITPRAKRCRKCASVVFRQSAAYLERRRRSNVPFTAADVDRLRRLTETYGIEQAATIFGTSSNAIRIVRKRGWIAVRRSPPRREMPTDFAIQAGVMTIEEMVVHYRTGLTTLYRWIKQVRRTPMQGNRLQPMALPTDWQALVKQHGFAGAARIIGCHPDTLRKRLKRERAAQPARGAGWADQWKIAA